MTIASFDKVEWIDPWKDRRPMTDDWVLVTLNDEGHKYVTMSRYEGKYGWFIDDEIELIAWMPMPDPANFLIEDVMAYVEEHYDGKEEDLPL